MPNETAVSKPLTTEEIVQLRKAFNLDEYDPYAREVRALIDEVEESRREKLVDAIAARLKYPPPGFFGASAPKRLTEADLARWPAASEEDLENASLVLAEARKLAHPEDHRPLQLLAPDILPRLLDEVKLYRDPAIGEQCLHDGCGRIHLKDEHVVAAGATELERAKALLKRIEWSGFYDGRHGACPACGGYKPGTLADEGSTIGEGHSPRCGLATLIGPVVTSVVTAPEKPS